MTPFTTTAEQRVRELRRSSIAGVLPMLGTGCRDLALEAMLRGLASQARVAGIRVEVAS